MRTRPSLNILIYMIAIVLGALMISSAALGSQVPVKTREDIKLTLLCWMKEGKWVRDFTSEPLYRHSCMAKNSVMWVPANCRDERINRNTQSLRWYVPRKACPHPYLPFHREDILNNILHQRNVLFLGDSLTEEFFVTMNIALRKNNPSCKNHRVQLTPYFFYENHSSFTVYHARHDLLSLRIKMRCVTTIVAPTSVRFWRRRI